VGAGKLIADDAPYGLKGVRVISAMIKGIDPPDQYYLSDLSVAELRDCVRIKRSLPKSQVEAFKVGLFQGIWPRTIRLFNANLEKSLRKRKSSSKRVGRAKDSLKESTKTYLALYDTLRASEPNLQPAALLDRICKALGLQEKRIPAIRAALKRQKRL